jgi:hypothetical protein
MAAAVSCAACTAVVIVCVRMSPYVGWNVGSRAVRRKLRVYGTTGSLRLRAWMIRNAAESTLECRIADYYETSCQNHRCDGDISLLLLCAIFGSNDVMGGPLQVWYDETVSGCGFGSSKRAPL